jgi:hypothetical protein
MSSSVVAVHCFELSFHVFHLSLQKGFLVIISKKYFFGIYGEIIIPVIQLPSANTLPNRYGSRLAAALRSSAKLCLRVILTMPLGNR